MIRLTCTNCQTVLEMDDAFAGGVCRCQHCGTIQTVPSHLKDAPTTGVYPKPTAAKSLYKGGRPGTGAGTATGSGPSGLDNLADVVASSGLGSGNLAAQSNRGQNSAGAGSLAYHTPTPVKKGNGLIIGLFVGIGVLVLVVVLLLAFLLIGKSSTTVVTPPGAPTAGGGTGTTGGGTTTGGTKVTSGPNFCGVPLSSGKIVFILDRGDASKNLFDPLKAALYKSLGSLGADREFQVIFWRRTSEKNLDEGSYPVNKTAKATPQELSAAEKKFEDLTASGATEIGMAINAAMARSPGEIVIATPKGYLLDDSMVGVIEKARGSSNVKIHTVGLGIGGSSNVLKTIAQKTGGTYLELSESDLRNQ